MKRLAVPLSLALALFALPAKPAMAKVFFVDDDGAQCAGAFSTTIAAAVAAASNGDTIQVCAGLYPEQVVIGKTLTIRGWRSGTDAQTRFAGPINGTTESIVGGPGKSFGFSLQANNIIIDGFTFQGITGGTAFGSSSVFSGYQVINNIIQNNRFGCNFNSSGANLSTVARNFYNANNGGGTGFGIYSDQGLQNALIDDNSFFGHLTSAIQMEGGVNGMFPGAFQANVTISRNTVGDAQISLNNNRTTLITENQIFGNRNFGIVLLGSTGAGVQIVNNQLAGIRFTAILLNNTLTAGGTGVLIDRNEIFANGVHGIALVNARNNTLTQNQSTNNGGDGIIADGVSTGNLIDRNAMGGNGGFDADDQTPASGGGTPATTSNTWTNNSCNTQNKAGLCAIPYP